MKTILFALLILVSWQNLYSQNFQLQIFGDSDTETKIIDSLKSKTKHKDIKSMTNEISKISSKLNREGFIDNLTAPLIKKNDSIYTVNIKLG